MIITYPHYFDQTQIIGLSDITRYHGRSPIPYERIIQTLSDSGIIVQTPTDSEIIIQVLEDSRIITQTVEES